MIAGLDTINAMISAKYITNTVNRRGIHITNSHHIFPHRTIMQTDTTTWMWILIILIIVIIIILIVVPNASTSAPADLGAGLELFQDPPAVLTTMYPNHLNWMNTVKPGWALKQTTDAAITNASPSTFVVAYPPDGINGDTLATTKGYFVCLASLKTAFKIDCGYDLGGMRVGYFDRADIQFINALISGYRMDRSQITIIPLSDPAILGRMWDVDVDIVITCIVPFSPFHFTLMQQRVSCMGFNNLDIDRINVFYTDIVLEKIQMSSLFYNGAQSAVLAREEDTRLPVISVNLMKVVPKPPPTFSLDAFIDLDPRTLDPSYHCYGDPSVDIRALCESKYDVIGQVKHYLSTWDQPCVTNTNCPFYDSGQQRGGCKKTGECEFPVAVRRLGFKKYDASGVNAPFKNSDGSYAFGKVKEL